MKLYEEKNVPLNSTTTHNSLILKVRVHSAMVFKLVQKY